MTDAEVKSELSRIRAEYMEEVRRHRATIGDLENSEKVVQCLCPHSKRSTYMGTPYDPSGETCDICGKDLG